MRKIELDKAIPKYDANGWYQLKEVLLDCMRVGGSHVDMQLAIKRHFVINKLKDKSGTVPIEDADYEVIVQAIQMAPVHIVDENLFAVLHEFCNMPSIPVVEVLNNEVQNEAVGT